MKKSVIERLTDLENLISVILTGEMNVSSPTFVSLNDTGFAITRPMPFGELENMENWFVLHNWKDSSNLTTLKPTPAIPLWLIVEEGTLVESKSDVNSSDGIQLPLVDTGGDVEDLDIYYVDPVSHDNRTIVISIS